jgi:hypothetical protein
MAQPVRQTGRKMIDIWDHETNATEIYRQAGIDPAEPPGPHALARALMGGGWLSYLPRLVVGWGFYSPSGLRERIYVRRGLTAIREAWTIYHEIAERHLYREDDPLKERACNQLAACLRAPRQAFLPLVDDVGLDLPILADAAVCSQTSAAMRYSETVGTPVAIVTPVATHVRGEAFGWPGEHELRRLAKAKTLPHELRRVPITDARGRNALIAAA